MDLGTISAIGGGLGTGLGIAFWLSKRELARILEVVERVPDKDWFERVEQKINDLPSSTRFDAHFKAVHDHANILNEHEFRLGKLETISGDHEVRIRAGERRTRDG